MPVYYKNISGFEYVSNTPFLKEVVQFRIAKLKKKNQVEQEAVPNIQLEVSDRFTLTRGLVSEKRLKITSFNNILIKSLQAKQTKSKL